LCTRYSSFSFIFQSTWGAPGRVKTNRSRRHVYEKGKPRGRSSVVFTTAPTVTPRCSVCMTWVCFRDVFHFSDLCFDCSYQMKLLERRMCHDTGFDTRRMSLTLTKFGNPEVCELARKESALFTKTSEWMSTEPPAVEKGKKFAPENVEKETEDRKKRPSRRASRDAPKVEVTAGKDASADKCVYENYRHKNGLQRKAFVSANSQRRSSLGLKKSPEQQPEPTEMPLSGRKRRLPSNGGGEASEPLSHNDLENRSSKRAKAWTTWRTQGAAASPSAYRVKTENASQLGKDDNSKTHSCARGARFTRSSRRQAVDAVSCAENEKSARSSDGDNHLPCKPSQETTPKSHLVVKWDSDKTDDPEIVTKVNPDPHKLKRPKPGKRSR